MRKIKWLRVLLLLAVVSLLFALTGCPLKNGTDTQQPSPDPAAVESAAAEKADTDQKESVQGSGEASGEIAENEDVTSGTEASDSTEQETDAGTDAENDGSAEIIVPEGMGFGDL